MLAEIRRTAHQFAFLFFVLIASISITSCSRDAEDKTQRILIWHSWPAPESELLKTLLENYKKLFPKVHIVLEHVPLDSIQSRFDEQVQSGMGPDLFIGLEVPQLCHFVKKNYLRELSDTHFKTNQIKPKTLSALKLEKRLYGIPFSASTHVLYYNKSKNLIALNDLESIIAAAQKGRRIGIPLDFTDAYWGIDAFNGKILDADNQLDLNQGYKAWMQWLHKAQAENSIIFDSNYIALRDLFASGELDYFIGKSRELPYFTERMAGKKLGVSTLPAGHNRTPGGLLEVETMAVNKYSTRDELAIDLMNYLTNVSSQRRVASGELGRIPINEGVRLNPRLSPDAAALKRQEQRAITIPIALGTIQDQVFKLGSELNEQVVQGVLAPEDSATEFFIRHAENQDPANAEAGQSGADEEEHINHE